MNTYTLPPSEQPKVAIVVPVYNVSPYLRECLDSILAQTYTSFNVFAVDDGSTDDCGAILDEYALKDSRITVIHQKNGGLSAARNTGLDMVERAKCFEFVAFIDSDDRVSKRYLGSLVLEATRTNADIVICGLNRFDENGIWKSSATPYPRSQLTKEMFVALVFSMNEGCKRIGSGGNVYNHLFRASIVAGIRFPIGRLIEDEYYCISAVARASVIRYTPEKLVDYRHRRDSLAHTADADEKLVKGRKLCIPVASTISADAGEIATAAYITAVVTLYKKSGITLTLSNEFLPSKISERTKEYLTPKTYRRFKRIYEHPHLSKVWFYMRRLLIKR